MTARSVRPWQLALLWFGIQLAWGALLGISLQARSAALNSSNALGTAATIGAAGAFTAALTQLIVGPLSDAQRARGSRRLWFYGAGVLLGAAGIVTFYLAVNVPALLAAFVLVQASLNVVIGPYQAAIPDFIERDRIGVASGWMAAMQSGGNATGALLAAMLGNGVVLGATIAAVMVACAFATIGAVRCAALQPLEGPRSLLRSRALADLFVSRGLVYLGFYTLLTYLFFYVRDLLPRGASIDATTASGICILAFTIVGAAGAALAARPADRLDERLVVAAGGGVVALAIVALCATHTFVAALTIVAVAGTGWGVFLCADWAFACRVLPQGALATAMAVWNLAVVGPQMLAPLLATALLLRLGSLHAARGPREAFLLAAGEILLGALWIWRLPRRA